MENKKVWFKRMWWGGRLMPCSKEGWMVCSIAIITALFFGLNFNGPMTNSFSLQFNGIAFAVVIVIFTIIAYIKAE